MEAMRQSWTDERLDDLNHRVDQRFDEVDKRFDKVDRRFDRMEGDIREFRTEMNERFDSLQRSMLQASVLLIVALLGVIATQL
jgi:chromosome segregation ATPase